MSRHKGITYPRCDIGYVIYMMRTAYGWSLTKLAVAAGSHRPYLSKVERNLITPNITTLEQIATALGLTMREFMVLATMDVN